MKKNYIEAFKKLDLPGSIDIGVRRTKGAKNKVYFKKNLRLIACSSMGRMKIHNLANEQQRLINPLERH